MSGLELPAPATIDAFARMHGGVVDREVTGRTVRLLAPPEAADRDCLAPVLTRRALRWCGRPGVMYLVGPDLAAELRPGARWVHPHPRWVLAALLDAFEPQVEHASSPDACVESGVSIGPRTCIGAGAVVRRGAVVGDDCVVEPHAVIYGRVRIGNRVAVGAGAVIGRAGFGWVEGPAGQRRRMPQPAGVVIEDDVEIGPLCTVDAGTLQPTVLRRGSKLDAHVHVGHNVEIGPGTLVAAQVGFAGSVHIGADVEIGGQAGFADHVVVGDRARVAGKAGVIGNIPASVSVAGYPAVERLRWLRATAKALQGRPR